MMKFGKVLMLVFWLGVALLPDAAVRAQETGKNRFYTGADIYSSYIWRGTKYGIGPHIQPIIKFTAGPLTAGGWGSFDFNGYQEADLFVLLSLPAGFSAGITDYYYPGLDYFDYTELTGSHAFEVNAGFTKGGFSLSANYIINRAGGAGSTGGDLYFQAGYAFKNFGILIGAGDGWHTSDGDFNICNIGLSTSRNIKITDSFSLPVTGQIIMNPEREALYIVLGITL